MQIDLLGNRQSAAHGSGSTNTGHVAFSDTHHAPCVFDQVVSLSRVSLRVPVPVLAVNLKCDAPTRQQEVDAVSPDARLLRKGDAAAFQFQPYQSLKAALSGVATVAGDGAETPRLKFRVRDRENLSARQALLTLSWLVVGLLKSALLGACRVAPFNRRRNAKGLRANRAYLVDSLGGRRSQIARPRAEPRERHIDAHRAPVISAAVAALLSLRQSLTRLVVADGRAERARLNALLPYESGPAFRTRVVKRHWTDYIASSLVLRPTHCATDCFAMTAHNAGGRDV